MSTQTISVLTPHGRRMNVKVQPNFSILQILEDVCKKYPEFSPNNYDLIHHKRTLDITQMFRFSGLPNNAALEMIEAKVPRQEENQTVVLCLQLEDGSRLTGTFQTGTLLSDVIKTLSANELREDTVIIYMRKQIFETGLYTTTLKSLGLTSGRAALRLLHKKEEELRTQANVSAPLPSKPVIVEVEKPKPIPVDLPQSENAPKSEPNDVNKTEIKAEEKSEMMNDGFPTTGGHTLSRTEAPSPIPESLSKKLKIDSSEMDVDELEIEPEIIELGDRNAILFSLDSVTGTDDLNDLPDSFFELTVTDMRKILRDLKNQRATDENAPLMTAKMRELEESSRVLTKLAVYKKTIIRVQFPDRLVLQGTFTPVETVGHVVEFVRKYLTESETNFYLFTTPPKQVLPNDITLVESNCVPQALLHLGVDLPANDPPIDSFIKEEFVNKISSAMAAGYLAKKTRGIKKPTGESTDVPEPGTSRDNSTQEVKVPRPNDDDFRTSSAVKEQNLPKWFKTGK